ncbi:MAG: tetratricopeptide repeat protein [Paracoccaceae bacterium]
MKRLAPLFPALLAAPVFAADCPPAPDHSAALDDLYLSVQAASSQNEARAISNQMWEFWADAPDEAAQELLDSGMQKRASYDFLGALEDFDRLIAYCPDYAEGYNQRAFVNYLRQDYASALPDLDEALKRSPRHVAAMSGRALTLLGLGRPNDARVQLEAALEINPWLTERSLLPGLKSLGQDI